MVEPYSALYVILGFVFIFGIIFPILEHVPAFKKIISFRWLIVLIFLSLMVGVVIDFSHLSDDIRRLVVIGAIVLSTLFVLVRTWEKSRINGWSIDLPTIRAQHGDTKVEIDDDHESKKD